MQISDLKTGQPGVMLVNPGLFALVAKVGDRKTGTGNYGDWSMQSLTLRDNSGELNAIIWGRPDLAPFAGKEVHLSALNTEGKGWSGCMVEDRSYQDKQGVTKTVRQIKASGVFLLEEAKQASPVSPNPSEPAPNAPELTNKRVGQVDWTEYSAVAKSAHILAMGLEPDTSTEAGQVIDRSRARLALVSTVLIAYGQRVFSYDMAEDDQIPF